MGSRTHAEMNIWLWKPEIAGEGTGHQVVVMLTRMHEDVLDRFGRRLAPIGRVCRSPLVVLVDCRDDRRSLHKIGTRANHSKNCQIASLHLASYAASSLTRRQR